MVHQGAHSVFELKAGLAKEANAAVFMALNSQIFPHENSSHSEKYGLPAGRQNIRSGCILYNRGSGLS